uniref:Uncharacterized protein n=1 Tax=viral metagenome TaxID=1070528 RepID=A0A6C0DJ62_9ZZZZ
MSSHDDEERDEVEEYEISNLLSFFKKNNIGVNGIFTFEGRTIFLFIQYLLTGIDFFIYIPSKFFIKPDNSVKNYFHINMQQEEEEKDTVSIFKNKSTPEMMTISKESLERFVPLFEESIYKLVYINKEGLSYINRYDSVDTFTFTNPFNKNGYYFMTDLENFYKESSNLEKNLLSQETLLFSKINNTFDSQLPYLYNILTEVSVDAKKYSGKNESDLYNNRIKKINTIISNNKKEGKSITECINVMSNLRSHNLKNIFYIEKITQFLKEIKEMREN